MMQTGTKNFIQTRLHSCSWLIHVINGMAICTAKASLHSFLQQSAIINKTGAEYLEHL